MELLNRFAAALKGAAGAGKPSLKVDALTAVHVATGVRLVAKVASDFAALAAVRVPGVDPSDKEVVNALLAVAMLQNIDGLCEWCDTVSPQGGATSTKNLALPAAVRRVSTVLLAVYWSNLDLAKRCENELHVVVKATEAVAKAA